MIGTVISLRRNDFASQGAKAALHSVADNRAPDFLGHREADPLDRLTILPITDEEDESGRRRTPAGVRSKKIRAFRDRG